MELIYHTSEALINRYNELTSRKESKINYYYRATALPVIAIGAGLFILFSTRHDLVALWVMLMGGSFLAKVKSHATLYHLVFHPPGTDTTVRLVTLTLSPGGLKEEVSEVVSFAPWHTITNVLIFQDFLIVDLASHQKAIIPRHSEGLPSLKLEEIRDEILNLKEAASKATPAAPPQD